jgi:hypothetical protein
VDYRAQFTHLYLAEPSVLEFEKVILGLKDFNGGEGLEIREKEVSGDYRTKRDIGER